MNTYFKEMGVAYANNREDYIKGNLPLVVKMATPYANGNQELLKELIAAGNEGLLKGLSKFDASKGHKYSTYARWWIKSYIHVCLGQYYNKGWTKTCGEIPREWEFDRPIGESGTTLGDTLEADDSSESIYNSEYLHKLLPCLTERERDVITRRYGIGLTSTTDAKILAEELNVTEQSINNWIRRGLRKMKAYSEKIAI